MELEVSVISSTKDQINREAHAGIQHVEATIQLDQEIEELKLKDSRIDNKTMLLKACL